MYGFGRSLGGVIVLAGVGRDVLLGLDLSNFGLVPGDDDPALLMPRNLGFTMGFGAQQFLYGLTIGLGGVQLGDGDGGDVAVLLLGLDLGDDDLEQVRDLLEPPRKRFLDSLSLDFFGGLVISCTFGAQQLL